MLTLIKKTARVLVAVAVGSLFGAAVAFAVGAVVPVLALPAFVVVAGMTAQNIVD